MSKQVRCVEGGTAEADGSPAIEPLCLGRRVCAAIINDEGLVAVTKEHPGIRTFERQAKDGSSAVVTEMISCARPDCGASAFLLARDAHLKLVAPIPGEPSFETCRLGQPVTDGLQEPVQGTGVEV